MCGFDELEEQFVPEFRRKGPVPPEEAVRKHTGSDEFLDEELSQRPQLRWSWKRFDEEALEFLRVLLIPFRVITRLLPKG